jgi:hypothetical protein
VLHCRRGADRTGVAAAIILLLQKDVPYDEARQQLGPRYGHVALGRTTYLNAFFDLYKDWLRNEGKEHSPAVLRDWVLHHYRGGNCSCVFEKVPPPCGPIPLGEPRRFAFRVRNDGQSAWHFRPTDTGGVHLGFSLFDEGGHKVLSGRAGLIEAEVAPGQSIDLDVILPAVHKAGRYWLFVDMQDEQQGSFYQMGSEPFEIEVRVGE